VAGRDERSHRPLFDHFDRWRGMVPAGVQAKWLGVHTDIAYANSSAQPEDTVIEPALPSLDMKEYSEWIDLLDADVSAGDRSQWRARRRLGPVDDGRRIRVSAVAPDRLVPTVVQAAGELA